MSDTSTTRGLMTFRARVHAESEVCVLLIICHMRRRQIVSRYSSDTTVQVSKAHAFNPINISMYGKPTVKHASVCGQWHGASHCARGCACAENVAGGTRARLILGLQLGSPTDPARSPSSGARGSLLIHGLPAPLQQTIEGSPNDTREHPPLRKPEGTTPAAAADTGPDRGRQREVKLRP